MGLLLVNTGDGKGKTTAALGLALRMVGHGRRVLVIQFLKQERDGGEYAAVRCLSPLVSLRPMGLGFVPSPKSAEFQLHKAAAQEALRSACAALTSEVYGLVILDELNCAVHLGLVDIDDMLSALDGRHPAVHVMVTGRSAHPRLIDSADMVTEMRCVKHHLEAGVCAQEGIEF